MITAADDTVKWVNLPTAGAETFLQDYNGGGKGSIYSFKRVASEKVAQYQYGYNQVRPWSGHGLVPEGFTWDDHSNCVRSVLCVWCEGSVISAAMLLCMAGLLVVYTGRP